MQLTNIDMIGNTIKRAKLKLSEHRVQGNDSKLNVYQVARLMDTVKNGERMEGDTSNSVLFSLN